MKLVSSVENVSLANARRPLLLLSAALLALLPILPRASAQGQVRTSAGEGRAALTLAQRLLGPWGDSGGVSVELSPGELPGSLPVALPLPEAFDLLGSLANYGPEGDLMHAQVVLDSPAAPDETRQMLEAAFEAAGWTAQDQGGPMGFAPTNAHVAALYCAPENQAFIHMNAFGTPAGVTDVRLEVNTQTIYSPCSEGSRSIEEQPPQIPLPALAAPEGSEITLHGGNYLEDQASSSAVIFTDLPPDELLRHFEAQLERSGWEAAPDVQPGESVWTLDSADGNWRGILDISDLGGSRPQYYASFVMVSLD